jgi:hypothetical protein
MTNNSLESTNGPSMLERLGNVRFSILNIEKGGKKREDAKIITN